MADYRVKLEAWLAYKSLGDGGFEHTPTDAIVNALDGSDSIDGATRRNMFLDVVYLALNGDGLLQEGGDQEARQALKDTKKRLQKLAKGLRAVESQLDAVLDDPHAKLGLDMALGLDELLQLRLSYSYLSVKMAEATVTAPPGRPQVDVDRSIEYIAKAWHLCFGKKPSPVDGGLFFNFIGELGGLGLMRTIDHSVLRRILMQTC